MFVLASICGSVPKRHPAVVHRRSRPSVQQSWSPPFWFLTLNPFLNVLFFKHNFVFVVTHTKSKCSNC